jgi:SagB-type dehydrogenase family enzyme
VTTPYLPAAREYHERTKLVPGQATARRIDPALIPRQYKRYVDLPALPLPEPAVSGRPLFGVHGRQAEAAGALTVPALAGVLHYAAGIVQRRTISGREVEFRAASCTGALYHVEVYVVAGDLEGLPAGVYHFDVPSGSLRALRHGDFRRPLAEACCDDGLRGAPASLVLTSTFWRNAWRYEERAYRHAFWDAGTLLANLLSVAEAHDLRPQLRSAFVDADVNALLGVDGRREVAVAVVALGAGPAAAVTPRVTPLHLETEALSRAEIEYPLIWQTHAATSLGHCVEVEAWRLRAAQPPTGAVERTSRTSSRRESLPVEAAIERRGSSRRFARDPMPREAFEAILGAASGSVRSDHAASQALCRPYVIVNAVETHQAGAYAVGEDGGLQLRVAGDLRAAAAGLALGQPAAGEAAVNLYFIAGLREMTEGSGERGYRALQLEAGIRTGQVYLAATSLGLGATGLTFYDDEVARLFGLDPIDAAVLMLVAFGPSAPSSGR